MCDVEDNTPGHFLGPPSANCPGTNLADQIISRDCTSEEEDGCKEYCEAHETFCSKAIGQEKADNLDALALDLWLNRKQYRPDTNEECLTVGVDADVFSEKVGTHPLFCVNGECVEQSCLNGPQLQELDDWYSGNGVEKCTVTLGTSEQEKEQETTCLLTPSDQERSHGTCLDCDEGSCSKESGTGSCAHERKPHPTSGQGLQGKYPYVSEVYMRHSVLDDPWCETEACCPYTQQSFNIMNGTKAASEGNTYKDPKYCRKRMDDKLWYCQGTRDVPDKDILDDSNKNMGCDPTKNACDLCTKTNGVDNGNRWVQGSHPRNTRPYFT